MVGAISFRLFRNSSRAWSNSASSRTASLFCARSRSTTSRIVVPVVIEDCPWVHAEWVSTRFLRARLRCRASPEFSLGREAMAHRLTLELENVVRRKRLGVADRGAQGVKGPRRYP